MRRKLLTAAVLSTICIMSTCAHAEIISGYDIDIPDEWVVYSSEVDDNITTNIYTDDGREIVCLIIIDETSLVDSMGSKILNSFIMDWKTDYTEYEGYYLMSDDLETSDETGRRLQQFVYLDEEWQYVLAGSKNTGTHIVSVFYVRPTLDTGKMFDAYKQLFSDYIL